MSNRTSPLQPASYYAKELRQLLPPSVFERNPWRLAWMPVHLSIIAASAMTLLKVDIHVGFRVLLALVIGHSYGCLMYLAHEILHGSVVKNRTLQNWLSGICMLPYCIGPAHWIAWHNRAHHGHTTQAGRDPDSFGNVRMIMSNRIARFMIKAAPGSRYFRSYFFLGYWFSFHALVTLFIHSKLYSYWSPQQRRRELLLFTAMAGFWVTVLSLVGWYHFAFLYVIPMVVANAVQMAYISTNHLFCDETEETNDPLVNSLTVSVPTWLSWLHLQFGYHVEHHVFPYVNPKHAPAVQAAIKSRFADRYHELPLHEALSVVYRTPPVHLSDQELVDLRNGEIYTTLGEHGELPQPKGHVPLPVRPRRRIDRKRSTTTKAPFFGSESAEQSSSLQQPPRASID